MIADLRTAVAEASEAAVQSAMSPRAAGVRTCARCAPKHGVDLDHLLRVVFRVVRRSNAHRERRRGHPRCAAAAAAQDRGTDIRCMGRGRPSHGLATDCQGGGAQRQASCISIKLAECKNSNLNWRCKIQVKLLYLLTHVVNYISSHFH